MVPVAVTVCVLDMVALLVNNGLPLPSVRVKPSGHLGRLKGDE